MGSGLDAGMTGGAVAIRALPSRAHPLPPPAPRVRNEDALCRGLETMFRRRPSGAPRGRRNPPVAAPPDPAHSPVIRRDKGSAP